MAAGIVLTVITLKAAQPVLNEYVIVAVPFDTPVTTPLAEPTLTKEEALLHVPPDVTSDNVIVELAQTVPGPLIAAGVVLTVIM
jgi:hypothetical protein